MERTTALKKLQVLLGKNMGWRINPKAPSQDEREAAKAALPAAVAERNRLREQRQARYEQILAADEEYQNLKAASLEAGKVVDQLSGTTRYFKITVGRSMGIFFEVKAEGDSWEEVIGILTTKKIAT